MLFLILILTLNLILFLILVAAPRAGSCFFPAHRTQKTPPKPSETGRKRAYFQQVFL